MKATTPQKKIICPICSSGHILFAKRKGIHWCRKCGHEWKKGK